MQFSNQTGPIQWAKRNELKGAITMGVEYAESKGLDHSILIFDLTLGDSFHIIGLPKAYILDWFFNLVLYMETHTAPYFIHFDPWVSLLCPCVGSMNCYGDILSLCFFFSIFVFFICGMVFIT